MAKYKTAIEQAGKVKIRVIEFEVEGSDATMQESLKSITAALNRGTALSQPQRVKYVQAPAQELEGEIDPGDAESEQIDDELQENGTVAQPSRKQSVRKPRSMKLLTDINFNDVTPNT